MKKQEHTLWYEQPASNFNETLPLGNGRLGACVYGGIEEERISLNEDTLWSGYPKEIARENYPEIYKTALALCNAGEITKAQKILEDNFGDFLVQMYMPLGNLKIKVEHTGEISGYKRELCLDKALHKVTYSAGATEYMRESFVSQNNQVFAIHFTCSETGCIDFTVWLESQLKCEIHADDTVVRMEGYAPECVSEYGDACRSSDQQIYADEPEHRGMGFAAAFSLDVVGGNVQTDGCKLVVCGADEATIYVAARTAFEGWNKHPSYSKVDYRKQCLEDLNVARKKTYAELKEQSIASYKKLYDCCEFSLGGSRENSCLPTDKCLEKLALGEEGNALYALLFNYGRYLAIASSREETQPTNLQGIWNEKIIPPWGCNYTMNINTEMNYWPMLACGLWECYEPFVRMCEELSESGRTTAKVFYGVDGWVSHHASDLWRVTHPATNRIKNNAKWGFWNMSSGWLSVMLWNYYRYNNDVKYLERVYPIMEGAARFYKQLLVERDDELILSPSTSPENHYIEDGEMHAIDKSTAMTQEILYDLFSVVSQAQDILGVENQYASLLPKLKKPHIQSDGLLCEWDEEHEVWDAHHRHVSHLYGLFPSNQFNEEQKESARKVLEQRGDGGTGWSLAWKINLWARLKDGEHALQLLDNQLTLVPSQCDTAAYPGGSYPNLFCAHPPFQIDGNFGAVSGILEMLVQTDEYGEPVLLPALPKKWSEGYLKGICLPNRKKISFAWKDGKVTEFEIEDR